MFSQNKHVVAILLALLLGLGTPQLAMAATNGMLTIITDPPNVSIWIDNQLIGQTPLLQRQVPVGRHTIRLMDQTQQLNDTRFVVIVKDSTVVLNVSLQKEHGRLSVTSKPDNAEVILITKIGKTPVTDDQIVPGAYIVEVRHPNHRYVTSTNRITIEKGKTYTLDKLLSRRKLLTTKAWWQIGLGVASVGSYIWSFESANFDLWDNGVFGLTLGTLCLVGVEVVALF